MRASGSNSTLALKRSVRQKRNEGEALGVVPFDQLAERLGLGEHGIAGHPDERLVMELPGLVEGGQEPYGPLLDQHLGRHVAEVGRVLGPADEDGVEAELASDGEDPVEHRLAAEVHEDLGPAAGDRVRPGAQPCREDDHLHPPSLLDLQVPVTTASGTAGL